LLVLIVLLVAVVAIASCSMPLLVRRMNPLTCNR
jgi:hypothetical protein